MATQLSRTTILIDKELWKRFKIRSIERGISASELLSNLIKKELGEKG
jgi:hypothetical protein